MLVSVGALSPSTATAQPAGAGSAAAAERLFDEGRTLMTQGRYEEACQRLAESQRLNPGTGTLLNLADCYEHIGREASAWATYKLAETFARRQAHSARIALAVEGTTRTSTRLAFMTIAVPTATPGLVVKRNEETVGVGSFGVAVPVDPGVYVLTATSDHHVPWRKDITVARAERVVVSIPALAAAEARAVPAGAPASGAPSAAPPNAERANVGGEQRALGWITTGVGVVGIGAALAFGISAKSKNDTARRDECTAVSCTSRGGALIDDAESAAALSTAFAVGGAIAMAGGIVLVLTAPRSEGRGRDARGGSAVRVTVRGAVLELGGAF